MLDRDPFALDDVDPEGGGIEQDVGEVVVEEVDLVDVEDAPVGLGEQSRLECLLALAQRPADVDRARHPVLGRVQRQVDDPPAPPDDGQLGSFRGALGAGAARVQRRAAPRAVGDGLDLGQQRRQAADGGRLRGAARPLDQQASDSGVDGVEQRAPAGGAPARRSR